MKEMQVWVGFSDGKPHRFTCETDGDCLAVFPTRKAARQKYEDVRSAMLVLNIPEMERAKTISRSRRAKS